MATKQLIVKYVNSKTKPGPIHKLKAVTTAMNSDWLDHTHNPKIQTTHISKHIYIYIFPLPPSTVTDTNNPSITQQQ